jgi:hypothetical protein
MARFLLKGGNEGALVENSRTTSSHGALHHNFVIPTPGNALVRDKIRG